MSTRSATHSEFSHIVNNNELVFIDFWAHWCSPCQQFSEIYETISEEFPEILFVKVNVEAEKKLVDFFELRSIPYLMIYKKGAVIYADAGTVPESTLRELARQTLAA